jgi:hypothetical protein
MLCVLHDNLEKLARGAPGVQRVDAVRVADTKRQSSAASTTRRHASRVRIKHRRELRLQIPQTNVLVPTR